MLLKTWPDWILCEHCDALYHWRPLTRGEVAHCHTCGAVLYRGTRLDLDSWLALTVAAALAFIIANVEPVIRIRMQGQFSEATLWQSVLALADGAAAPVALVAGSAMVLVPLLEIVLLLWVLMFATRGRAAPGGVMALRGLRALRPWSMVEVALLAALVSIVKLAGALEVHVGVGLWAVGTLTLLLTMILNRDLRPLWQLQADCAR